MINGRVFDWESIKVILPFGAPLEVTNISYDSESPSENVHGAGRAPRGYGRGNLVQNASMDLPAPAFLALSTYASANGGMFNIPAFNISVGYANDDQIPQVDTLPSCTITKVETSASQGDTEVNMKKITLMVHDPISFNGQSVL